MICDKIYSHRLFHNSVKFKSTYFEKFVFVKNYCETDWMEFIYIEQQMWNLEAFAKRIFDGWQKFFLQMLCVVSRILIETSRMLLTNKRYKYCILDQVFHNDMN